MNIYKLKNKFNVIKKAYEISEEILKTSDELNLVFTGGRFGEEFSKFIISKNFLIKNKNFYLTDERISKDINQKNNILIFSKFKKTKNFEENRFIDFEQSIKNFKNNFSLLKTIDLVFLSLGEDGHLAGHFPNSINLTKKICYTHKDHLSNFERISFRIDFLVRAEKIVLAVIGKEKRNALIDLLEGLNFHSKNILCNSKDISIITDVNI